MRSVFELWRRRCGADSGADAPPLISALVVALRLHDRATMQHSLRVAMMALEMGVCCALDEGALGDLVYAALLHDLGKLVLPRRLLRKRAALNGAEWSQVRQHPLYSAALLRLFPPLAHLAPLVRHHHERWDGRGYPDGLVGAAIPLASHIVMLADTFDCVHVGRPYRAARGAARAWTVLRDGLGSQFDPALAPALRHCAAGSPTGNGIGAPELALLR